MEAMRAFSLGTQSVIAVRLPTERYHDTRVIGLVVVRCGAKSWLAAKSKRDQLFASVDVSNWARMRG